MIMVISDTAEAELKTIGDCIAEANPTRALSFVIELRRRREALPDTPRGFSLVPRYERLGIRRPPYGNYLIFYRVLNDTVEVLHLLVGLAAGARQGGGQIRRSVRPQPIRSRFRFEG
ncbi:MAG TPA: type II toxin-antitoxin system RelE/ParE family toxin [Xanthobacteraceae bacterium]|nr:type II toxin-antitoxin system RelE/ParE family toxin [Xanthobacteraceae bacterium]